VRANGRRRRDRGKKTEGRRRELGFRSKLQKNNGVLYVPYTMTTITGLVQERNFINSGGTAPPLNNNESTQIDKNGFARASGDAKGSMLNTLILQSSNYSNN
jgi:hypothetical protein